MAYFLRAAPAQRVHASVSAIVSVCLTHRTRRTSFECAFTEMLTVPLTLLPTTTALPGGNRVSPVTRL